jgi:peptide/nickel transport system permease protein
MRRTPLLHRLAMVWLALVLLATLTAHWLPIPDPLAQSLSDMLAKPGATRWFGADSLGRDVFSRTIHGFRITLVVSLGSVAFAAGGAVGLPLSNPLPAGHRPVHAGRAADRRGR